MHLYLCIYIYAFDTHIPQHPLTPIGQELSEIDTKQINELAQNVIKQIEFKKEIQAYLGDKMVSVCPNLTALIGENVLL